MILKLIEAHKKYLLTAVACLIIGYLYGQNGQFKIRLKTCNDEQGSRDFLLKTSHAINDHYLKIERDGLFNYRNRKGENETKVPKTRKKAQNKK